MNSISLERVRDDAYAIPLDRLAVSEASRFQNDTIWPYF